MANKFKKPHIPKFDTRLLGTWKSDAKRTLAEWRWRKNLSPAKRKKCGKFFGSLEITYTRKRVIRNLPHRHWTDSQDYSVLGANESSVAVCIFGEPKVKNTRSYDPSLLQMAKEIRSEPEIQHIHFEKDYYWVAFGRNREFFRKLRKA